MGYDAVKYKDLKIKMAILVTLLVLAFTAVCESQYSAQNLYARAKAKQLEEMERSETCMGDLGCFNKDYPWGSPYFERWINLLPDERDDIAAEFRFYAPGKDVEITKNQDFAVPALFDASLNTKFIIHGYMGGNSPWVVEMKDAFQKREQCNVFLVDWSGGHGGMYEQAVANTRVVGAETGLFIQKLVEAANLDVSKVHVLGHSLGAHTAGYAGKWVQDKLNHKVARITGLDPAGPYFNGVQPLVRLDIGDADLVDVIHTNWAENRFSGFGLLEPVGHFDFYPNGGEDQPGCKTASQAFGQMFNYVDDDSGDDDAGVVDTFACSHSRGYELFTASLQDENCGFYSRECKSWNAYTNGECNTDENKRAQMGYDAVKYKDLIDPANHIKFYLTTSAKTSFCLDQKEP